MEQLPIEIILHIYSFGEHPLFLTRSSCVCKAWQKMLSQNALFWKAFCKKWASYDGNKVDSTFSLYKDFLPKSDTPSNWIALMKECKTALIFLLEVFRERRIRLSDIVSVYNSSYQCKVEQIYISKNKADTEIKIYIDERGDNSLGQ